MYCLLNKEITVINYYCKGGSDWIDEPKPTKSHISDSKSTIKKDFSSIGKKSI